MVWRHGKLLASSEMCGDIGEKWELVMRSKGCERLGGFCVDMGAKRAKNWANLCKPMHFLSQNLCKPMQIYALIAETPCLCSPPGWICWLRGNHTTDSVPCQGRRRGDSGDQLIYYSPPSRMTPSSPICTLRTNVRQHSCLLTVLLSRSCDTFVTLL